MSLVLSPSFVAPALSGEFFGIVGKVTNQALWMVYSHWKENELLDHTTPLVVATAIGEHRGCNTDVVSQQKLDIHWRYAQSQVKGTRTIRQRKYSTQFEF